MLLTTRFYINLLLPNCLTNSGPFVLLVIEGDFELTTLQSCGERDTEIRTGVLSLTVMPLGNEAHH